ncbi:MAG: molybdopterin-dependent oxidoreductase, partial [Deltaproteobacteria bacterium]|nr:molybdopterin-dependent oxidoreductase [Deltaproteobacteria bacterium]
PVAVERGRTILEAAQSAGVRIPSLCHDRRLIPFGACRLCVVEEKGKSDLLPSCFTPAKKGMEIITHSPKITESRKAQLQLILLNHPMTCPRCEKEGECDLQSLVYEYGINDTQYPWDLITFPVDHSPLLQRDANKCILCGRCVRICDEVQGVGELSFTRRGIQSVIDTDFHRPIQCEFCGQCLDTCPVGAITSNCFDYKTKSWELMETTTPCPYCGVGCLLTIGSREGEIKRVFSTPEHGPNDGNLCVKGRFGWDVVDSPDRLKSPLLRANGSLGEVPWEEALGFVAQRIEEIKDKYGPQSIGAVISSRLANEEYFLFKKLFKEAIGTEQIALNGGRGDQGLAEGLSMTLGFASSTNSIKEIREADCILIIGVDPAQTHPIIKNEVHLAIRKNKAQLIVLGSHDIGLSQATHISPLSPSSILLPVKPGRELSLLNAMAGVILKEGFENQGFIGQWTEGIEELRKKQDEYLSSLSAEERSGVEKAVRAFAQSKKAMILIGSGPWSHPDSERIALACSNLALLTGHIGKEGSGILLLLEKCNTQGAIDMGILSEAKGMKDLFKKAEEGNLKALYLVGKNPALSPRALENLELLVVQDLFMTEAAKGAHVVLPACSFVEKSGTYTNLERRVQKLHPLRPPKGQSKSDFEIFLRLLRRLEVPVSGETPETLFQDVFKINPQYQGLQDGEQWPKGAGYLYEDGFPMGKAKLIPLAQPQPKPQPDDYPFCLIEKSSLFQSGEVSLRSENLKRVLEKPSLEMNIEDAQSLKIDEGEMVELSSPVGKTWKMKVHLSSMPDRGVITVPYSSSLIEEGKVGFVQIKRLTKNI